MLSETGHSQEKSLQPDSVAEESRRVTEHEGGLVVAGCGTRSHAIASGAAPGVAGTRERLGPVVDRLLGTLRLRDDQSWRDLVSFDGFDE